MKEKHIIYRRYVKRIIDIVLSSIGIVVVSPVLLISAILIKRNLGSPVCLNQLRSGKNGKSFKMYKFRSMTNEIDEDGNLLPDEKRITPFGQKIRKYSIDELPQFINIFKGNMSIIGPRPLPVAYKDYYDNYQAKRLNVKPGIVGLASIRGRNCQSWESKFAADVEYVSKCSPMFDIYIFFKAIIVTIKHENVDSEGYASGEPFLPR